MRITIIHPFAIVRDGLRRLLQAEGCEIVADAGCPELAAWGPPETAPDVVFLGAGDEPAELRGLWQLRSSVPDAKIIVLSMGLTHESIDRVLQAGAAGYLLRSSGFDDLLAALRAVARSDCGPGAAVRRRAASGGPSASCLTGREREVVSSLAAGNCAREIARLLCISEKTVDSHRQKIKKKLGLDNLASITKFAIREGLCSLVEEKRDARGCRAWSVGC